MAERKTLVLNKSQNEEHWIPCGQCHAETKHKVLLSADINGSENWGQDHTYWWADQYQIVQCLGCETISFRKCLENSEDEDCDEIGNPIPAQKVEVYPSRVAGRHQLSETDWLPFDVARIYNETHSALCSKMPILAGIGIRAVIEAICKEKAVAGKNLEEKIDNLVSMGVLTKDAQTFFIACAY